MTVITSYNSYANTENERHSPVTPRQAANVLQHNARLAQCAAAKVAAAAPFASAKMGAIKLVIDDAIANLNEANNHLPDSCADA